MPADVDPGPAKPEPAPTAPVIDRRGLIDLGADSAPVCTDGKCAS